MFSSEQLIELSANLKALMGPICRSHNLSFAQFLILSNIPSSGVSLKKISYVVGSEISTMSRNIDKLIAHGLISKTKSLRDKRKVNILRRNKAISLLKAINKDIKSKTISLDFEAYDGKSLTFLKNALEQFSWVCYKHLHEK